MTIDDIDFAANEALQLSFIVKDLGLDPEKQMLRWGSS